jgi:uncharacterized membrane protein
MIAAIDDTGYEILLVLHILAVVAAFAPAVAHPLQAAQATRAGGEVRPAMLGFMLQNGRRVYSPALIIAGILGFGLIGMSDDAWEFSDGWIIWSILLWIVIIGVVHGLLTPAERRFAGGDDGAGKKVQMFGMIANLLFIVTVWLMVAKPGA